MVKDIAFADFAKETLEQIKRGAFLVVQDGDKANIMTIGWGSIGFIWKKPVFTVLVRYSRYTYDLLEKVNEFTVNVPLENSMSQELSICGTRSGRDIEKFKECRLTQTPGKVVAAPVIKECDLFYECRIICRQAMQPALVDDEVINKCYPNGDYHVIFYGEILASYKKTS
ncbi:MAG: flavin reductase family protein [Desulfitobacteriaceae bacterium]|nr:flavin reductase family protein [Desulfitobacteriaceae bacterium]MDD4752254.1 flavin reductase family protein [Desulfitobacteriaceae bacterium]